MWSAYKIMSLISNVYYIHSPPDGSQWLIFQKNEQAVCASRNEAPDPPGYLNKVLWMTSTGWKHTCFSSDIASFFPIIMKWVIHTLATEWERTWNQSFSEQRCCCAMRYRLSCFNQTNTAVFFVHEHTHSWIPGRKKQLIKKDQLSKFLWLFAIIS